MLYKKVGSRYVRASAQDIYAEVGRLTAATRSRSGPSPTLTDEQKAGIRRRVKAGEKQNALATEHGVSPALVSKIVSGKK